VCVDASNASQAPALGLLEGPKEMSGVVAGSQINGRVQGPTLERGSVSAMVPTRWAPEAREGPARGLGGGLQG